MGGRKGFFTTLQSKLLTWFLVISIVPVLAISVISYMNSSNSIRELVYDHLESMNHLKAEQISEYIIKKERDLGVLAQTQETLEAFLKLKAYHDAGGSMPTGPFNAQSEEYGKIYQEIDPFFQKYVKAYNFTDIFFICKAHGHVMYTQAKEGDLGTNLSTGRFKDSGLGNLWEKVVKEKRYVFEDYTDYAPSGEAAAFIGVPVFDKNGQMYAVLAVQLSTKRINEIMQQTESMGETGETYLVGEGYLMRSGSRFEKDTMLKRKIDTIAAREALAGKSGEGIIEDYRGVKVLSNYRPVKIGDTTWAVISEIDTAEAFRPIVVLRISMLAIIIITAVIIIIIAVSVARSITKPVKEMALAAQEIAGGDLTTPIQVKSSDEIGILADNFKTMSANLRNILSKVQEATSQITSAGNEILSASQEQASGAREQSSAVAETTSAARELSTTSEQVGESIKRVSEAAIHALAGTAKIKDSISKTGGMITSLSEKSQKIGKMAELIDDVADQTNLLAVNASIEAARAGEQGKGFTVVADEIRKLSDSTAKSTKDITALIEIIQHEMTNSIMSMESSVKSVDEEARLAHETSERSKEITMSVTQQISGSKQIAEAMTNLDEAMKQIAAGAQQSQAAAKQLAGLAKELKEMVEKFNIG